MIFSHWVVDNQGEKDAAAGEYHRPYNFVEELFMPNGKAEERNDSYDAGHKNGTDQKK